MSYFSRQVQTIHGVRKFYFNRIYTVSGIKYHISHIVPNGSGYFMMIEKEGIWKIDAGEKTPEWILELEDELSKVILDEGNK